MMKSENLTGGTIVQREVPLYVDRVPVRQSQRRPVMQPVLHSVIDTLHC